MVKEHRWEEPLAKPLYVTVARAGELLDVPYSRMIYLAHLLETRYFGPKGGARRVSMRSIDEFLELREAGADPVKVLAARKERARLPATPHRFSAAPTARSPYRRRRQFR